MKCIVIILLILTTSCRAQIYPLNSNKSSASAGSYFKDLDGELDKYVGLWKANWNGKTVFLELKKVKYAMDDIFIDRVLGERKIINSNGQIEIDRITNFDYVNPEFRGMNVNPANLMQKRISFYPKNMCGMQTGFNITNITATTMTLHMGYIGGGVEDNCIHNAYVQQHGEYPINFPKDIVLTKQ